MHPITKVMIMTTVTVVQSWSKRLIAGKYRQLRVLSKNSASGRLQSTSRGDDGGSTTVLPPIPENCHRVVFMRHGESEFNNANVFTGWCDVALTQRGIVEAVEAGQVFAWHDLHFRKCYASLLSRSIVTAQRSLEAAGISYTPIEYDWRLNERHYGALQGLSKERTADRLGRSVVMQWRRSYQARPPFMTEEHPHFPIIYKDPRYLGLEQEDLPLGESLQDCQLRVVCSWNDIVKDFSSSDCSQCSMVVAHANTLRALIMHLDSIPTTKIQDLNIPTAIPFYYDICMSSGKVVDHDDRKTAQGQFRGVYISDDQKRRNFLERRRAANDPYLWALHDHEVTNRMLNGSEKDEEIIEGMSGVEDEAHRNTQLFSTTLKKKR